MANHNYIVFCSPLQSVILILITVQQGSLLRMQTETFRLARFQSLRIQTENLL